MESHTPVVSSNYHTACTGLLTLLNKVNLVEALTLVGGFELLSELVVAYTAGINDGVGGQNVLRITQLGEVIDSGAYRLTAAPRAAFCAAPPAT